MPLIVLLRMIKSAKLAMPPPRSEWEGRTRLWSMVTCSSSALPLKFASPPPTALKPDESLSLMVERRTSNEP